MKIRIATTSPLGVTRPGYVFWTTPSIDGFAKLFIRGDKLAIDNFNAHIANLTMHNPYIATLDVLNVDMTDDLKEAGMCPYRYTCYTMRQALARYNAPKGRAAFHNIQVDYIPDDFDPLKSPTAERKRRK